MIGSLKQFMPLSGQSILQGQQSPEISQVPLPHLHKRRGKSTFQTYTPDDKTDLLVRYQMNNIYNINRKKYNQIAREAHTKQRIRKPMVQHHSFFVKPEITKDYIAKQQLKRKHNLLRAILRMKQNQQEPNKESDYQQSFQRLYSGFKNIHPEPILYQQQKHNNEAELIPEPKKIVAETSRQKSSLGNKKRLEFEHCLSWARKHNKNGDFFAEQLGKNRRAVSREQSLPNRSLIEEIGKKVGTHRD